MLHQTQSHRKARIMAQSLVSKRSLALLGAIFMLTGCPDTQGRYDEFADRSEEYRAQPSPDFGPAPEVEAGRQDLTGSYLFTIATELDPGLPLMFRADVVVDQSANNWTLQLTLHPLQQRCGERVCERDDPGFWTVLDAPIEPEAVAYADDDVGTFVVDLGSIFVPGVGNPFSASDIEASLVLYGETRGADSFCGEADGALVAPFPLELTRIKNTFGGVRVGDDGAQPLAEIPSVGRCP